MNDTFVKARVIFDRMMEESLARHSGREYLLFHRTNAMLISSSSIRRETSLSASAASIPT